jgi:hypothetical protein
MLLAMTKQSEIPMEGAGVAPVRIAELDKLADDYVVHRDRRIVQLAKEIEAKRKLIDALHAHDDQIRTPSGTLVYRYDDSTITLTPGKEKLKVENGDSGGGDE